MDSDKGQNGVTRFRKLSRRRQTGVAAAVLAAVVTAGYVVVTALAAPAIPAPVITGSPHNTTKVLSAAFTFHDSRPGVTFRCSLDGSPFGHCPPNGTSYGNLAGGNHTFSVEAGNAGSFSAPASYSWFVEPPPVTVTFPVDEGAYDAATWSAGCRPTGICGSADNLPALRGVDVGIYQQSSHRYWNGSSFSSSLPVFNAVTGTTKWNYAFTPPQDGDYTVFARAFYTLGHSDTLAIADFTYENVPPPAPLITSGPTNPSTNTSPEFIFTDTAWPDVTFSCSLDSGAAQPCTGDTDHDGDSFVEGERQFTGLAVGPHCFSVFATDEAGLVGPTTKFCWDISGVGSSPFTVGGNLTSLLYPGISRQLDLTFTNPNSSAITIADGAITRSNITITSDTPGCAASNFMVVHGLKSAVTIPADRISPMSLAALAVPRPDWPLIKMIETNTNQDACEGARLTLTYSKIEASG